MRRNAFDAAMDKRAHVKTCESEGFVADSMEVRLKLMERVGAGEISLQDAQSELARIKKNAKKNGLLTRNQAYLKG